MNQKIKEETKIIDKFSRDIHKHLVEYTKGYIKEIAQRLYQINNIIL